MEENSRMDRMRNTWVEVDLDRIIHNINEARKIIPAKTRIAAVVKANAYGHGAVQVSRTLIENNVDQLAVACLSEALELRKYYDEVPILVLGYTPDRYLPIAVKERITLTVFNPDQARKLSDIAAHMNRKAVIHIKLDTGLNRIGLKPCPEIADIITGMCRLRNIEVEGLFTHLALTSEEKDREQFGIFMDIIGKIEACGIHIPIKHINDSNGMVLYPEFDLDMVRLGGFIYGVTTVGLYKDLINLRPAMTFKTQITQIKEIEKGEGVGYEAFFIAQDRRRIGTLAVGFSDGYMRALSGKAVVGIRGKKAPVIGFICMDQCMVDLTDIPEAEVEDEVLLFGTGSQDIIHVNELAEKVNTNRNEILSNIGRRVPRVYIKDSHICGVVDYLFN